LKISVTDRRAIETDPLPMRGGLESEKTAENRGFSRRKTGAGEAIRTLDPNLGKVVLYP
jgi:hypothetical protein